MSVDDEKLSAVRLLRAAEQFLQSANSTIQHSNLFRNTYAVRFRVKDEERLADKIRSKKVGDPAYDFNSVTDIVGIRFITLYRQDIPAVAGKLLELLFDEAKISPNIFGKSKLMELKSFISSSIPSSDLVSIEIDSIYKSKYDKKCEVKFEMIPQSRYSSVHMVARVPFLFGSVEYSIPIEFQLRSVFEDAWAEIDHKLLYELGRFGQAVDATHRESMTQHMGVFKKILDTAADYADVIRRTIVSPQTQPVSIPRNLDGADYIREIFKLTKVPKVIEEDLVAILNEKIAIDEDVENVKPGSSLGSYIGIADNIGKIYLNIELALGDKRSPATRALRYTVRMEEALARLLSNNEGQLHQSILLYGEIVSSFPEFVTGWFRFGQALQRSAEIDTTIEDAEKKYFAAIEAYEKAEARLSEVVELKEDERWLLISPRQESYIKKNVLRLQSFARWRMSDRRRLITGGIQERDLQDVTAAYKLAMRTVEGNLSEESKVKAANNAAYYGVEAIELAGKLGVAATELPTTDTIRSLLALFEKTAVESADVLQLDTAVRGYVVIGESDRAKMLSEKIIDAFSQQSLSSDKKARVSAYVEEAQKRAFRNAWEVVRPRH